MPAPPKIRPFILEALSKQPMTATQLAKAGGFDLRPVRKTLIELMDDRLIHRIEYDRLGAEPRAYRYAVGATSALAVPPARARDTGKPRRQEPPPVQRDPMQCRLFGRPAKPKEKPPARDPFQAFFFGAGKKA